MCECVCVCECVCTCVYVCMPFDLYDVIVIQCNICSILNMYFLTSTKLGMSNVNDAYCNARKSIF